MAQSVRGNLLTDIFAFRYSNVRLWDTYGVKEKRLVVQTFSIVKDHIARYYDHKGNENPEGKGFWEDIHRRLSVELGLRSLSQTHYSYQTTYAGKSSNVTGAWPIVTVCENWAFSNSGTDLDADSHIKERLSLVEIAFRREEERIKRINSDLPKQLAESKKRPAGPFYVPGDPESAIVARNKRDNDTFNSHVEELNKRFRQAGCGLHYHNGPIQVSEEGPAINEFEAPFWSLVSSSIWQNVDHDMKEAVDRRDRLARDPQVYASNALESTIKIISCQRGWTTGKERGAANFIENITKNGLYTIGRPKRSSFTSLP